MIIISDNDEKILLLIRYMSRDGVQKDEIIARLGITKKKFTELIKKSDKNTEELIYEKMITDYQVEDALLKKALGGVSTEVKKTEKKTGTETVTVTKEVPADTSALQFWLKNKCPEKWSDKAETVSNTEELLNKIFDGITQQAEKQL